MKWVLFFFVILSFGSSCDKNDSKYPYAIKDFSKTLRPYLKTIVAQGYVGYDTSEHYIKKRATDKELNKLSYSEHPVLRALALRTLLERKKDEHYNLIISHLDDTSTVAVDEGEWGINFSKVADYMIENAYWKTLDDREKIIDEVLFKHNDLKSAFEILPRIEPKGKYYQFIRKMAAKDKWNYENEKALYALSKFKKPEDITLIKQQLRKKFYFFKDYSFDIMREFQDTAFLNILEEWSRRRFIKDFCQEEPSNNLSGTFVHSIAVYKHQKVADIFSKTLNWKSYPKCRGDINELKKDIYEAIGDNQCDAYSNLMDKVKAFKKKQEEFSRQYELKYGPIQPVEPERIDTGEDPNAPKITWWDYDHRQTKR